MAGAIPKRTADSARPRGAGARALALPRFGAAGWLPPLLLALATVLALAGAYTARPTVTIDVGDYYDLPYLPNTVEQSASAADFYAREVGQTGPGEEVSAWPADQQALELPGHRSGLWQVTVVAADGQPNGALSSAILSVNGTILWTPRHGPRDMVAIIPPELAAADTFRLRLEPALSGNPIPPAGLAGQVKLAPARTYRWTRDQSTISLPGLGRGDWLVSLTTVVEHPDGKSLDAQISANGVTVARLPDGKLRRHTFLVPAALVPDGDLTLSLRSNTYKDPRDLGLLLYEVSVSPAGALPIVPPLKSTLYALVVALCLYVCLRRMTGRAALAAALALLVVLAGAWALVAARYPSAFMLPRLALLALWSVALLLVLERLLSWAFRAAGVPLSDWLLRALLLTFFAGYWIKAGGMLYPYFVGIDMRLQMQWTRRIFSGEFWTFYGINNPMNELTMPAAEWGANRPIIPYSPWFHIFAGLFFLLPMPTVLAGHMFSALVDTSRVFLLGLLARKAGFSERESLCASLLIAVTPATFLLHSWGNLPTTFGIWWTLVCTVFIVAAYRRLDRPGPFAILTLLLTVTLLIYTVMAAFMTLFLVLLVAGLWLTRSKAENRRPKTKDQRPKTKDQRPKTKDEGETVTGNRPVGPWSFALGHPAEGRSIAAIGLSLLAAIGLSTLIFYGQYIPPIIERTVPYFLGAQQGQQVGVQQRQPFLDYLAEYWPRMGYFARPVLYGLQLPLLLAAASIFAVRSRRLVVLLLCWATVAALFLLAGSRIAMVDKQVFYLVPALALLAGSLLGRLWSRGAAARLVVAGVYLLTLTAAIELWLFRIMSTQQ